MTPNIRNTSRVVVDDGARHAALLAVRRTSRPSVPLSAPSFSAAAKRAAWKLMNATDA